MLHYKTIQPATLELLKLLQSVPELANCRMVGGTALALQIGHRSSIDIDLFGNLNIELVHLQHILENIATYTPITSTKAILTCLLNNIKVDIVN